MYWRTFMHRRSFRCWLLRRRSVLMMLMVRMTVLECARINMVPRFRQHVIVDTGGQDD